MRLILQHFVDFIKAISGSQALAAPDRYGKTMQKKKKTLITSRRFERITVRRRSGLLSCGICGEASELLSIEESGLVFGINLRSIFRLVENGQVHFAESPAGLLLICTVTLQQALMKPEL